MDRGCILTPCENKGRVHSLTREHTDLACKFRSAYRVCTPVLFISFRVAGFLGLGHQALLLGRCFYVLLRSVKEHKEPLELSEEKVKIAMGGYPHILHRTQMVSGGQWPPLSLSLKSVIMTV